MRIGHVLGIHRVIEPEGALPQPSWRLDNSPELYDNELLIDVTTLNIDSASFKQMKEEADGDLEKVKEIILKTVETRGKQHNPVTGSGGMLIGRIKEIGKNHPALKEGFQIGDEIATLVSLSLTPLSIEKILSVHEKTGQVEIKGEAVLFASGIFAKLPSDLPKILALAVLDVAGAPAQTSKLVKPGQTVVVLGAGGKSGLLSLYQAKKQIGSNGKIIALEYGEEAIQQLKRLQLADEIYQADARNAPEVLRIVEQATNGQLADVTINCVNVPNTELSSILATKDEGKIYFFSMATSFTSAALGAEGFGKDVEMIIGNGYTKGHAEIALNTIRESIQLRDWFEKKYVLESDHNE